MSRNNVSGSLMSGIPFQTLDEIMPAPVPQTAPAPAEEKKPAKRESRRAGEGSSEKIKAENKPSDAVPEKKAVAHTKKVGRPQSEHKRIQVTINLDEEVVERIIGFAEKDRRSKTAILEMLVVEYIDAFEAKHGFN